MSAPTTFEAPALEHDAVSTDWLTLTSAHRDDLAQLLHGETVAVRPWWPYKWAEEDADGVRLLGGGPALRPYLIDFNGKSLRQRRAVGLDDFGTVAMASFHDVTCTRLDLARDVTSDLTPLWLHAARNDGRTVSLWRRWKWIDEDGTGQMVRCGGKESETALRVYDKRAELLKQGLPCSFPRLTRWELVLRGSRAQAGFHALGDVHRVTDETTGVVSWPIHRPWCAWVSRLLKVAAGPVDKRNKHHVRIDEHPAWAAFVSATDGTVLTTEASELSPQERAARMVRWFESACAPTLFALAKSVGWVQIHAMAQRAQARLSAAHRNLLRDHLLEAQAGARGALAPRRRPRRGTRCEAFTVGESRRS
jgi:hypothetical protein